MEPSAAASALVTTSAASSAGASSTTTRTADSGSSRAPVAKGPMPLVSRVVTAVSATTTHSVPVSITAAACADP